MVCRCFRYPRSISRAFCLEQAVDVLEGVVNGQGSPHCARYSVAVHQRFGAVVSGAYGDPLAVQQRTDIRRMRSPEVEGKSARFFRRVPVDGQAFDAAHFLVEVGHQLFFTLVDLFPSQGVHEVDGGSQADGAFDVGCPGFETERQVGIGRLLEGNPADHLSPSLIYRKFLQQAFPTPQRADARGGVHLVSRESVKIAPEGLDIHRKVRNGLCTVYYHDGPCAVCQSSEFGNGIDRAQYVRYVSDSHDACAGGEQRSVGRLVQQALFGYRDHAQVGAARCAGQLPGHDVGVVLHLRDEDLVPGL